MSQDLYQLQCYTTCQRTGLSAPCPSYYTSVVPTPHPVAANCGLGKTDCMNAIRTVELEPLSYVQSVESNFA